MQVAPGAVSVEGMGCINRFPHSTTTPQHDADNTCTNNDPEMAANAELLDLANLNPENDQVLLEATLVDNLYVEATPVNSVAGGSEHTVGSQKHKNMEELELTDIVKSGKAVRQLVLVLALLLCLGLAIVVPLVLVGTTAGDGDNIDSSVEQTATVPPTRRPPFHKILHPYVLEEIKRDPYSTEALANEWMQDDPNLETYSEDRLLQRFTLACFWYATNRENTWKRTDQWMSHSVSECDWYTVHPNKTICDENNVFRILNLTGNALKGTIPEALNLYGQVVVSDVSHNKLAGTIPSISERSKVFEVMDYSYNDFEGHFSVDFGISQISLRIFKIQHNRFGGTIPIEVAFMPNLTHVDATGNQFQGRLPDFFGVVEELEVIRMGGNLLGGTLSHTIGELSNLRELDLSGTSLSGALPVQLEQLPHLEVLNVANTSITGSIPQGLCDKKEAGHLTLGCGDGDTVQCC
ncbi:Leucine rich repeat N-terminal domain [Seminavis robusta]|uniref:Leucine rich repeat N-terminal domain n=1 Tax=Seminavis robusta TaxID=568900 RepID=A0A9N8D9N0_9STRA|nr:Leucine rich repeat N-terminal domain [Seminavis robusta]|eukprot:Sro9_g007220.1 Leucine rich repeat N-terminal domain (465) ;mRNA; f:81299-82693